MAARRNPTPPPPNSHSCPGSAVSVLCVSSAPCVFAFPLAALRATLWQVAPSRRSRNLRRLRRTRSRASASVASQRQKEQLLLPLRLLSAASLLQIGQCRHTSQRAMPPRTSLPSVHSA